VANGVRAVAVALRDLRGTPIGSIGIAAIRSRMMPDRIKEIVPWMLEEREEVERLLGA
jgi:DNA-binding IclR family transcriptional regulator